ncbi:MAG: tetraacyldisaccharide 4'-kinase [Candidatus Krumholzibacteriota bacterium]|nr:tetraacyldisaccharide 4'-kinase [Candidatus Krumholzibacteriota bacterium]
MEIIERYDRRLRVFAGRGGWAFLLPLRYLLAALYWEYLYLSRRYGTGKKEGRERQESGPLTISIGNIEIGGGGKTPAVIAFAGAVKKAGGKPVIVTRGYRGAAERAGKSVVISAENGAWHQEDEDYISAELFISRLVSEGRVEKDAEAAAFGDEAAMLARRGFIVIVDPVRDRAVRTATRLFGPTHIFLDDAFQQREIWKDIDILLLDHDAPLGKGWLLPAGTLREPGSSARRADVVIFTRATDRTVPERVRRYVEGKKIFFAEHLPSGLRDQRGKILPFSVCQGREVILFSGIARPDSFESTVRKVGIEPVRSIRYPDHASYTKEEIERILSEGSGSTVFITTEKDRAKSFPLIDQKADVYSLEIEMKISAQSGGDNEKRSAPGDGSFDINSILITR